jgi:uncharacterized OB-fold protein
MDLKREEAPAEIYRRYLESGKLGFQRCGGCGAAVFYPRVLCPVCGSGALEWRTSSGRGVVYATTAVHRREDEPYNVCLVELEEGFRMMSRIESVAAGEVEIGLSVTFEARIEGNEPVAVFVPETKPEAG